MKRKQLQFDERTWREVQFSIGKAQGRALKTHGVVLQSWADGYQVGWNQLREFLAGEASELIGLRMAREAKASRADEFKMQARYGE